MALPSHVKVDRFMRAAFTAINVVPKLGECTQQSVLAGLMQAAQLGLEVSDVRGQCFLIPRNDNSAGGVMKASFQLGYRGMIDLAARSGITVDAEELHDADDFDYSLGTSRFLRHKPTLGPRGPVLAYYATATFADKRTPAFTIMSLYEVMEHRDKFASTRKKGEITGPWVDHFDAMARKTVIRALLNYLPVAVELRDAIHADAIEADSTEMPTPVDYGARFQVPELPENVDGETGEIDPMTVTETTGTDVVECTGAADCPATAHIEGCFAVTELS
jgi:recombination protein RecT